MEEEKKDCPYCATEDAEEKDHSCCSHESGTVTNCCGRENEQSEVVTCCCGKEHVPSSKKSLVKDFIILIVSLAFLVAGYFDWHDIGFMPFYYVNPSWVAVILLGFPIFIAAAKSIKRKKITTPILISMTMLVSIALEITAFFYDVSASGHTHGHSNVFAAGEIAFLMGLGGFIEDSVIRKTHAGVEKTDAAISRTADKLAGYIVPSVLAVSVIVGLVSGFAFNLGAVDAIIRAGTVLVAFCPCSLALAAPIAIAAGLGNAAIGGVIIRNGESLEKMSRITLSSEGKSAAFSELRERGQTVLTVAGDSRDASSDCSVTVAAVADGAAKDDADITIPNGDVSRIEETLKLAKRTIITIKCNIIISMAINVVAVVASFMGWLTPVTGALVHNCTTVFVVLSSALLLYRKKKSRRVQ